jgi:hypothetical protein
VSAYPFRFYGRRPNDWYEGANLGHLYEVKLAAPPDPASRAELEQIVRAQLETGRAEVARAPFRWQGEWLLLAIGERRPGPQDAFFNAIERVMLALHARAPIVEVIFWGVRGDSTHPWDVSTLAEQPVPSMGPHWEGLGSPRYFGQPRAPATAG